MTTWVGGFHGSGSEITAQWALRRALSTVCNLSTATSNSSSRQSRVNLADCARMLVCNVLAGTRRLTCGWDTPPLLPSSGFSSTHEVFCLNTQSVTIDTIFSPLSPSHHNSVHVVGWQAVICVMKSGQGIDAIIRSVSDKANTPCKK